MNEKGLSGGYIVSKYGSWNNVEAIQIELRYTTYIENRVFGEEEVTTKNVDLFKQTQARLVRVFENIKAKMKLKNDFRFPYRITRAKLHDEATATMGSLVKYLAG